MNLELACYFLCLNRDFLFFFFDILCNFVILVFQIKYVGDEQEKRCLQMKGLNLMDKTLVVRGARIAFRIWDVGGICINFLP